MPRVRFENGKQREFVKRACRSKSLKAFWVSNYAILQTPYNTLKHYYSEKLTLPYGVFYNMCSASGLNPHNLKFEIIPDDWWQGAAGKKGIVALEKKYGKEKMTYWRKEAGKKSLGGERQLKDIKSPILDEKLAELVGAYLGDGTLTNHFIRISGDFRYDLPYFRCLSKLVKDCIGIDSTIKKESHRNTAYLEIRSKRFCDYLINELNLKTGDKIKNKITIPEKIASEDNLLLACIRGLIDTDGSVSKDGKVLSVRFTSHNPALINQLWPLCQTLGIFTFKSRDNSSMGTRSFEKVRGYFELVGSSNPRHVVRFIEYLDGKLVLKKEVLPYYDKYSELLHTLPYKSHRPRALGA